MGQKERNLDEYYKEFKSGEYARHYSGNSRAVTKLFQDGETVPADTEIPADATGMQQIQQKMQNWSGAEDAGAEDAGSVEKMQNTSE